MIEKIKAMGLEVDGNDELIDVRGDNAKLMELKRILDDEGYQNDTETMKFFFGTPIPKDNEVNRILINYVGGETGYMLVA